jgi:hypothetical protein
MADAGVAQPDAGSTPSSCNGRSTEDCYCLDSADAIGMAKEARAWRRYNEEVVQQQAALPPTMIGSCVLNLGFLLWAAWRWARVE